VAAVATRPTPRSRAGPLTGEALAILLGGGKHNIDEGYKLLTAVQAKQQKEFAQRLRVVGLTEMADTIMRRLAQLSALAA